MDRAINVERHLEHIANMLLLNSSLLFYPGLIHGKMGVAIFFFHHARYTGNELFKDYAVFLIGEIMNQIYDYHSLDYENGLAGIGAGIDYLAQNDFIELEENTFDDFDRRMYLAVMHDSMSDFSLYNGLSGYGKYWLMRLSIPATTEQAKICLLNIYERIKEKLPFLADDAKMDTFCLLYDLSRKSGFEFCNTFFEQYRALNFQLSDKNLFFPRLSNSNVGNFAQVYLFNG